MYTYEDTLARLRAIAASKPYDYKYVTDPQALEASREVGDDIETNDFGEQVATGCYYRFLDGTPGCLLGHLLYEIDPDFVPAEEGFQARLLPSHIQFEDDALELLKTAQLNQDCGSTWTNAVEDAEMKLRKVHQDTLESRDN